MKVFISTSATFYDKVSPVIKQLELAGHVVIPPNGFGIDVDESMMRDGANHQVWKEQMLREDIRLVKSCDAILVLNFEKNGHPNYVGASAFLELFKAFELNKKKFILNPLPGGSYYDELLGMNPKVINGDLWLVN